MKKETFHGVVNGVEFEHYEDMVNYVNDLAKRGIPVHSYKTEYKTVCGSEYGSEDGPQTDDVKTDKTTGKVHKFKPVPQEYADIYDYLVVDPRTLKFEVLKGFDVTHDNKVIEDADDKLDKRMQYFVENIGENDDHPSCVKARENLKKRVEELREHFESLKAQANDDIDKYTNLYNKALAQLEILENIEGYNEALHDICCK